MNRFVESKAPSKVETSLVVVIKQSPLVWRPAGVIRAAPLTVASVIHAWPHRILDQTGGVCCVWAAD